MAENQDGESELNTAFMDEQGSRISTTEVEKLLIRALESASGRRVLDLVIPRCLERVVVPVMEPFIRRVVKEEFDFAQEKLFSSMKVNSGNRAYTSGSRELELQFKNKISQPVLTGKKIEGEDHTRIKVALVDAHTGQIVDTGPEATAELEIVVLEVDPSDGDAGSWTLEEFNSKINKEKKLQGKTYLKLNEGTGFIDEIYFKQNSSWTKNHEYRLGARFVDPFSFPRVIEAKTESFLVKDQRGKLYEKRYPPLLTDEVWRLEQICKGGAYCKRLNEANVNTVKDFLILLAKNQEKLKIILNAGSKKIWEVIVNHAQKCTGIHLYRDPSFHCRYGVAFNVKGELMGLTNESQYIHIGDLSEVQKDLAGKLFLSAYEHWEEVITFDDEASLISNLQSRFPSHENHNDPSVGAIEVIDRHNHTIPSNSSQIVESSFNSRQGENNLVNSNLHNQLSITTPESEHWKDAGTITDGYIISESVSYTNIQPDNPDVENSRMTGKHGTPHAEPSPSFQTNPFPPSWTRNSLDDLESSNAINEDIPNDIFIESVQTPDGPIHSPDDVYLNEWISQFLNQYGSPSNELHHPEQGSCITSVLPVAGQSRWIQLAKLLRRNSMKRKIGILAGIVSESVSYTNIQPDNPDVENSRMTGKHGTPHAEPSPSFQTNPFPPSWTRNSLDDLESSNAINEDIPNDISVMSVQTPDGPIHSPDDVYPDEWISQFLKQYGSPSNELHHPEQGSCITSILPVAGQSRWIQLAKLLRRNSMKRKIGILAGIEVLKRQRCC